MSIASGTAGGILGGVGAFVASTSMVGGVVSGGAIGLASPILMGGMLSYTGC